MGEDTVRSGATEDGPWPDVVVVQPPEEPPETWDAAVFLAGPTPRTGDAPSWRPAAVDLLRAAWRDGPADGLLVVFVPEPRGGWSGDYLGQVGWEDRCLNLADEIVFYVPRDLDTLPGFTTNVEWGAWHDSGKAVFGAPPEAPKNRYLLHYAAALDVPTATTLEGTVAAALTRIGTGARRTGGEREIPLLLWRQASVRQWYEAQRAAGNRLLGARVVWSFPHGRRTPAYWALHVRMHVAAERRIKDNEIVISRPDTSVAVLYGPVAGPGRSADDTPVVLVREFRSPAATPDGFVHEPPGGSGPGDPESRAIAEVAEETGFRIDASRLRAHGARQPSGTVSAHRAHLFSAEITEAELAMLRERASRDLPLGVAAEGERTYVEVATYGEIRRSGLVDWATLGMLAHVLGTAAGPCPCPTSAASPDSDQ